MDKETRNRAKAVNFGIVYGISPFGLAQQLNIEPSEARIYIDRYFERYSGVKAFIEQTLEKVRQTQSVRTVRPRSPHSRHHQPQCQYARLLRAHCRQYARCRELLQT